MKQAVLYARVSSDRQELEETIQSQLAELRDRILQDGLAQVEELIDEGYGRDNLVRPGLDRLRDIADDKLLDRVYIQCPDRLAGGARLILLVEELQLNQVEVVFLKGSVEDTPEGKLLLHMQGAMAEFERTKIAGRTRRGKLYWARQGAMVGGRAPYGCRFVRRSDTERARLEVNESLALVVRQIYRWLTEDCLSTRAIARRLTEQGILTSRGAIQWQPTAIDRILKNTVYKGYFIYQRTEAVLPSRRLSTDRYHQSRKTGSRLRSQEEWISIPVPPIVSEGIWELAQQQLRQNSLHSPRNNKRYQYLLSGLVRCTRCGSTYTGFMQHGHRGYRCHRAHPASSSTGRRCRPGAFSAQPAEDAVWQAVTEALRQPEVLAEEYHRRLEQGSPMESIDRDRRTLAQTVKHLDAQEDRITEAYIGKAMDLERY